MTTNRTARNLNKKVSDKMNKQYGSNNSEFMWKYEGAKKYGWVHSVAWTSEDEAILHLETLVCAGICAPMVKFNRKTGRAYFLTERASDGSYPWPEFENKGYQARLKIWDTNLNADLMWKDMF